MKQLAKHWSLLKVHDWFRGGLHQTIFSPFICVWNFYLQSICSSWGHLTSRAKGQCIPKRGQHDLVTRIGQSCTGASHSAQGLPQLEYKWQLPLQSSPVSATVLIWASKAMASRTWHWPPKIRYRSLDSGLTEPQEEKSSHSVMTKTITLP